MAYSQLQSASPVHSGRLLEYLLRGDANTLIKILLSGLFIAIAVRGTFVYQVKQIRGVDTQEALVVGLFGVATFALAMGALRWKYPPMLATLSVFVVALFAVTYSGYDSPSTVLPIAYLYLVHHFPRRVALIHTTWITFACIGLASVGVLGRGTLGLQLATVLSEFTLSVIYIAIFGMLYHLVLRHMEAQRRLSEALEQLDKSRADEMRQLAMEERAHLSRELHDTLGHHLTATRINTQVAQKLAHKHVPEQARLLAAIEESALHSHKAMRKLQEVVSALGASQPSGTLVGTMQETAQAWPSTVELSVSGDESRLPPAQRLVVFRTFQESLTNSYKHAYGETVHVTLEVGAEEVTLQAWNNRPFEAVQPPEGLTGLSGGSGLEGLAQRAAKLGGTLQVTKDDSRFCTLLTLPLPAAGPSAQPQPLEALP